MAEMAPPLYGSFPPLICPFHNGAVDEEAYARLVEFQISGGSHGVVVNGSTGEPTTLTIDERKRVAEVAIAAVAGRRPVVVATGSDSHAQTVALTTHAEEIGAAAALIVTPYYVRPSQEGLTEYYVDVARRTELPILIYHIPGRAAVGITVESVARIRDRAPNVVGIKHAVNDLAMVTDMISAFGPEFSVFAGLEDLSFPMLAIGAAGLMNAVANIAPARVAALDEAMRVGDLVAGRAIHFELSPLNRAVFYDTNPVPIKYMMRRLGLLQGNEHRLPLVAADRALERRLDGVLEQTGLLRAVEAEAAVS